MSIDDYLPGEQAKRQREEIRKQDAEAAAVRVLENFAPIGIDLFKQGLDRGLPTEQVNGDRFLLVVVEAPEYDYDGQFIALFENGLVVETNFGRTVLRSPKWENRADLAKFRLSRYAGLRFDSQTLPKQLVMDKGVGKVTELQNFIARGLAARIAGTEFIEWRSGL